MRQFEVSPVRDKNQDLVNRDRVYGSSRRNLRKEIMGTNREMVHDCCCTIV